MKTPVTGSVGPSSGMSLGSAGSATAVGSNGGMVLWRNQNTAPATTNSATTRNAIVHQCLATRRFLTGRWLSHEPDATRLEPDPLARSGGAVISNAGALTPGLNVLDVIQV